MGSSPQAGRRHRRELRGQPRPGPIPASGEGAHPRERGDDINKTPSTLRMAGSSPRAGRRPRRAFARASPLGLIPASGETTPAARSTWTRGTAHPRERGDDTAPPSTGSSASGSSPRAGRRLPVRGVHRDLGRLIPASGETTRGRGRRASRARAHPREQGDDTAADPTIGQPLGSSPRAGRRPDPWWQGHLRDRLIPASGETTSPRWAPRCAARAHPRERGDDDVVPFGEGQPQGSSPRAGRRRRRVVGCRRRVRLIPASGETTDAGRCGR